MGSGIGSSNFRDQPRSMTQSIVVVKTGCHSWRSNFVAGIARWARHTGGTARAGMRAEPWLIGMVLTDPSATIAMEAFHRLYFRRLISSCLAARCLFRVQLACLGGGISRVVGGHRFRR